MASKEARLILRLIDGVSGPAGAIVGSLNNLGKATKTIVGASFGASRAVRHVAHGFRRASYDAAGISVPIVIGAKAAAQSVYDYEKVGNEMQAVGLLTDKQREKLEAYGKELNAQYPFINKDILEAAAELLKAGQTFDQTIGSLGSTLNTALAGDMPLRQTADIMTNIAQAMRLPIATTQETEETMKRVSDALAYAATNSNTNIAEMAQVFKYVAPLAASTGMSLEELAANSMVLANNGIKASNAGTGLRFAIGRVLKPSKEALKALKFLNIEVSDFVQGAREVNAKDVIGSLALDGIDASGMEKMIQRTLDDPTMKRAPAKLVSALSKSISEALGGDSIIDQKTLSDSLAETLTVLGTNVDFGGLIRSLRDNPNAQALIPTIFGARHGPKILALMGQDVDSVLADLEARYRGSADKMSKIRIKGVVGDITRLAAAFDNLRITVSDSGVLTTVTDGIKEMTKWLTKMGESSPEMLRMATYGLLALGAIAPLGFAMSGVASAVALAVNPLTWVVGSLAYLAAINFDAIVSWLRAFGKILTDNLSPEVLEAFGRAATKLKGWFKSLVGAGEDGEAWARTAKNWAEGLAAAINKVYAAVSKAGEKIKAFFDWSGIDPAIIGEIAGYVALLGISSIGLGLVAGPISGIASALLTLSGVKLAWGVLKFLARLAGFGAAAAGVSSLAGSVGALGSALNALPFIGGAGVVAGTGYVINEMEKDNQAEARRMATHRGAEGSSMKALALSRANGTLDDAFFDEAKKRSKETGTAIEKNLNVTAKPVVDSSSINWAAKAALGLLNTLRAIGNSPSMQVNMTGIAGGQPDGKRAAGGPIRRGLTYEINERGRETITMGTNGYVTPAHRSGGGSGGPLIGSVTISGANADEVLAKLGRTIDRALSRSRQLSADDRPVIG